MKRLLWIALVALAVASPALALDAERFPYARELAAPGGPVAFEPDGPLFAHARPGLADLRVVDVDGRQVPWRFLPAAETIAPMHVPVLNAGRQGGASVALLDVGIGREPIDRIALDLPDKPFVGRVEVLGSDDRENFTRLSSTAVYDVRGARKARSTVAVIPASDFRFYQVRVFGIGPVAGASVAGHGEAERALRVPAKVTIRQRGKTTVVIADVGYAKLPVEGIRVLSSTPRFDRPVGVEGSRDGRVWTHYLGGGNVYRFDGPQETTIPVDSSQRYLRLTIANGDDEPLRDLRFELSRLPRAVLLSQGFTPPYTVLYGNPRLAPPDYDFAQLPRGSLALKRLVRLPLPPEGTNPQFAAPGDTGSFVERNDWLVQAALGVAALVVAAAGFAAFRRRA